AFLSLCLRRSCSYGEPERPGRTRGRAVGRAVARAGGAREQADGRADGQAALENLVIITDDEKLQAFNWFESVW
ncbi:MAG: hypothetical protein LBH56_00730, partial [Coriobacteriales bacterium]|nr:hypothetical protein [Coriobacteriales bacterium]